MPSIWQGWVGGKMDVKKVTILVKRAAILAEKLAVPVLAPYDLTLSQYRVLKYLLDAEPATVRQVDVEYAFDMTNPTVTGIVTNLESAGWVTRVRNPHDARSKVICLTDKATSLHGELNDLGAQIDGRLTERLTEKEAARLAVLLDKMLGEGGGRR